MSAFDRIPAELRERDQWVVWRSEDRDGKPTKVPYQADGRGRASSTKPTTWATFDEAVAAAATYDGIGYVFAPDDPFCGLDLDGDMPEADQGSVMLALDSYTERSVSGTGCHIIVRASLNGDGRHPVGLGVFDRARYFVMTGEHVVGTPLTIEERQTELEAVIARYLPTSQPSAPPPQPAQPVDMDDRDLLRKAFAAKNGSDIEALFQGDWKDRYESQSQADQAFCNHLAFWTGRDAARMDRLFRESGLMRSKWDARRGDSTYGGQTIANAIANCHEAYDAPSRESKALSSSLSFLSSSGTPTWPKPLELAYHGLAGDWVRAIEPHTEADPVALLSQFLTGFGNIVGNRCYVLGDGRRHPPRLFVVLVGDSSRSRKGTSMGYVRRELVAVDPTYEVCIEGGLSSGEGLIYRLRDRVLPQDEVNEERYSGRGGGRNEENEVNEERDPRLLVVEEEFASVLKVIERHGNTLSPVLRKAFDGDPLSTLTRSDPLRASNHHISVIAHITTDELRKRLTETEAGNGFGNRFIWIAVRRSKDLPEGGNASRTALNQLQVRLHKAYRYAVELGTHEFRRDVATSKLWAEAYSGLLADYPGLVGSLTSRAEAHVTRLSLVYALLDQDTAIREPHLNAALDLWRYTLASVTYAFGDSTGNSDADAILQAFRAAPDGLTRWEINKLFGGNLNAARIGRALLHLHASGLADFTKEDSGGRPTERWFALEKPK